jgi:hypothetical protein
MRLFLIISALLLAGCANGPSRWAQHVIEQSMCGTTVPEAEQIAGRKLRDIGGRSIRGTHVASRGTSSVWFDFKDNSLQAVSATWTSALARADDGPRRELCEAKEGG